jgi:hypothetical protein
LQISRSHFVYGTIGLGATLGSTLILCGSGLAAENPPPSMATTPDIIVTTPRGRTSGGIDPLLEVSPSELDSYGVDTLSELVDALRPLTRSSRSDQMAVVLINGHLAGQTEFDNLPREAIERVEVLPESVALQYGFSENQRVLNFILRDHYRAVPVRVSESGASEGGDHAFSADTSLVRLDDEARVTLRASYKDSAWLRESDRGIDAPNSYYRTLLPETSDAKIAGTLSRSLWGVSASVEASFDLLSAKSLQGLAQVGATPTMGALVVPLKESSRTRTARLATQITGQLLEFVWGATAYYLHVGSNSSSDTGANADGNTLVDRTESGFNVGNLQLSLSGPVASLPAGPIIANFKFALQYQGFETRDDYPGSPSRTSNLVRTVRRTVRRYRRATAPQNRVSHAGAPERLRHPAGCLLAQPYCGRQRRPCCARSDFLFRARDRRRSAFRRPLAPAADAGRSVGEGHAHFSGGHQCIQYASVGA